MLNLFRILVLVSIVGILGLSSATSAQSKSDADPLKIFTKCKWPGDLKVKQVDRRPESTPKYRDVLTSSGSARVSVMDGYRVLFGYKDLSYYFADVKIEQSDSSTYPQDKERVIDELKHLSQTKQATGNVYLDKAILNGFEHYGLDRDQIDVGITVGTHLLLYDPDHLVVTVYFLNQKDKGPQGSMSGNRRRFTNLDEYLKLRDDFMNHYSECLRRITEGKAQSSKP